MRKVRAAHAARGGCFFDGPAADLEDLRVETTHAYVDAQSQATFFVTSERDPYSTGRRYRVRQFLRNGRVCVAAGPFDTLDEAMETMLARVRQASPTASPDEGLVAQG